MRKITAAAVQMSIPDAREESIAKADKLVRQAAARGANVILLPELFETWYFCQERRYDSYSLAAPLSENPAVNHFKAVAKELGVVLPISFYERDNTVLYNSVAMIDADGSVLGVYRK
ncbi:MAG: nitrilase-related carbon-nitrogen hydrolase, partial [Oscillospiraceae bacterium]